ncbi:Putative glycosyltransferase EpsD [Planctomycetes bacterium Pan216]|uniref:Glycosyltransferase EpsD n=1 Tax=Kolteria novifilia TaxID=2527975 RepID=A0A518BCZ4_9BACT|nr:Putative glycosyltransferase EpsD [Planctomycetes bacterium Pan216]
MRVVHVITRMIVGGAQENTLHNIVDLHRDFGDEVTLITGPSEGPEGNLLENKRFREQLDGIDVRQVPTLIRPIRPWTDWRACRTLEHLLDEIRPDVVHTHSAKGGILGRAAADCHGKAGIVHTMHGHSFGDYQSALKNWLYIEAERWAGKRTDRFICVADAMTDEALKVGIAPREKFVTIHSGMDVDPFLNPSRDRDEVRASLGIPADADVVAKVARLFELKGHDDLLDATRPLVERYPNLHLLLIGDGILRESIAARAEAMGLGKRIHFSGLVAPEEIPNLLGAVDVVLHASYREGLARVLPQGLLAGKPVVSYDVGGAREVVLADQTGILVPVRDVAGLTRGLEELLDDPAKRERFGRTGRELFADQFRHQTMTRKIRAVYEEVIAERQAKR